MQKLEVGCVWSVPEGGQGGIPEAVFSLYLQCIHVVWIFLINIKVILQWKKANMFLFVKSKITSYSLSDDSRQ